MIGIVLPVKNGGKSFIQTVKNLINSTDYPFKLFIIDGGSTDGTEKNADIWAEQYENICTYHIESPGLITAINYGINRAIEFDCEGVYLTQDDVIHYRLYNRDWLKLFSDVGKEIGCGLAISIRAGGTSGPDYIDGLPWAGTWSTYIPIRIIKEIGLFDENYNPGNGDDIDYTYRVLKAGYKMYELPFWVDHHRQTEHPISLMNDIEASEKLKKNHAKYFRKKFKLGEYGNSNTNK